MFSPLMESIIKRDGIAVVTAETLDKFAASNGDVVLLAGGDWRRRVEVNDVAVILPEIVKASNGHLTPAIVDRESERDIQIRFRFSKFPSLIFLRNGEYLGVIQRVLDWSDYVVEINAILAREPSQPPAYKFPEGCAPAAAPAAAATDQTRAS